jgi:hypothetical protein
MSSMKATLETTGSDMEWQVSFMFWQWWDFTKSRRDATKQQFGTYTVNNISDGDYLH